MIECVWILIRDSADPMKVLERAHAAMGDDGNIIALKPVDDIVEKEGHEEVLYKVKHLPLGPDFIIRRG